MYCVLLLMNNSFNFKVISKYKLENLLMEWLVRFVSNFNNLWFIFKITMKLFFVIFNSKIVLNELIQIYIKRKNEYNF